MRYRCVATSLEGFLQQLSVGYISRGYWFWVSGIVPKRKNPEEIDRTLIEKFGVDLTKQARARRKRAGGANVQYLRHESFWVLLATYGKHKFFDEHRGQFRDVRRTPIRYGVYSVSFRGGHASVRLTREAYRELKCLFLDLCLRRSANSLAWEFWNLGLEPYAPIRRQLFNILREVNRVRKKAGRESVSTECIRIKRKQIRVFEPIEQLHVSLTDSQSASINIEPANKDDWRVRKKAA